MIALVQQNRCTNHASVIKFAVSAHRNQRLVVAALPKRRIVPISAGIAIGNMLNPLEFRPNSVLFQQGSYRRIIRFFPFYVVGIVNVVSQNRFSGVLLLRLGRGGILFPAPPI